MRSTVSSAAASVAGGRSVARATSVPIEMRSVSAATAPSSAAHSSAGRSSPVARRAEEVVVDEDAVQTCRLGRARDRERDLRVFDERREREPEPHRRRRRIGRSSASSAAPITPARSPVAAGTISGVGR